ncbi:MAG: type IX secretion system sortase PorU [Prevotellaceae bacterium]|nr:type IX secretion system sortase PorU [Prevotellaceae bacterium]
MINTKRFYTLLYIIMTLALAVNAQSRYAEHSKLAAGKWVKIRVQNEGIYQLTPTVLKNMGFSDPANVSLYGYNLPILPEANIENLSDDLTEIPSFRKSDGTMLFYSCGTTLWTRKNSTSAYTHRNNPYSNYIYYFLTDSGTPAQMTSKGTRSLSEHRQTAHRCVDERCIDVAINGVSFTRASTAEQSTYYAHSLHEEDAYSFLNAGRTFFENYDYASGNSKTYNIPFDNASCGDIIIDVQFGAAGNSSSTLSVSSQGNSLGSLAFSKLAEYEYAYVGKKAFTLYDQYTSSLSITLQHTRSSGVSGHLDYIRASYEANLSIAGKSHVVFSPLSGGSTTFALQGADANVHVWKVSSPSETHELSGTLEGSTYRCLVSDTRLCDKYVAVNTTASFPSPEIVGEVGNQDLHSLGNVNLLIIVPSNGKLTAQAQRLADIHTEKDGLSCAVVTADQVYNEFSSGTPDATAYRRLMKMLYDKQYTSSPLTSTQAGSLNLLLFGNCVWDNRLVTKGLSSQSQDDYLLAYESDNSWSHTDSYVMEEYFTLLADGKGVSPLKEKPDCGVGRIPVSTPTEARNVVDKLISYINNIEAGAWKNTICFMSDDGNENIHMEDAEAIISNTQPLFPDYRYKRIYWDSYTRKQSATGNSYPDVYAEINKTMQEGALIMNYTGHGAPYQLSHEKVLQTSDFGNWASPRLPLWVTAACDVAPFDMNEQNIACTAVLNSQGGAMGFIGTARTVYSTPNRTLNRYFMSHVLARKNNGERYTIGEALAQAKVDILASKSYYSKQDTINKVHFILLGDPAISLITPTYKIKIDKIDGNSIDTDNPPTISAGATVTVEGHIVDADGNPASGFNGHVFPTVYDSEEHIVCKNNPGDNVSPLEYTDRTRTLYSGADMVSDGAFSFTFPVPLDINYSDASGLITLYAVNEDKTAEAQGRFEGFIVGGTTDSELADTTGPTIALYLNSPDFVDGGTTNETPTLHVDLYDDSGINTTGNGLGHDIVAIIDGNEATTYTLSGYYSQTVGDYRSGTIDFTMPTLPVGTHTLLLRAFDTLNNMGEATIRFNVVEGLTEEYDIFDMAGRFVSSGYSGQSLPKGIYIRRTRLTSPSTGTVSSSSEKFIVTQ